MRTEDYVGLNGSCYDSARNILIIFIYYLVKTLQTADFISALETKQHSCPDVPQFSNIINLLTEFFFSFFNIGAAKWKFVMEDLVSRKKYPR